MNCILYSLTFFWFTYVHQLWWSLILYNYKNNYTSDSGTNSMSNSKGNKDGGGGGGDDDDSCSRNKPEQQ
jgi:hypothetical protein